MGGEVELTECRKSSKLKHQSKMSDQEKISNLLFDALNPERLSFDDFDLKKYLDFLLEHVAKTFELPLIILRTEDKLDRTRTKLKVLACYGFERKRVDRLKVNKNSSMAKKLATTKKCVYIKDLEDKKATEGHFDQDSLVEKMRLKELFSCPITVDSDFVGFIVFYKTTKKDGSFSKDDSFSDDQREFLGDSLIDIIKRVLAFAELMDRAKNRFGFLREAYKPERFSLCKFDLKGYLYDLIKDVGEKFKLPFIILRYEDASFPTRFYVMAKHGFTEEQKVPEIVYIKDPMAHNLREKVINGEKERFIHLKNIQNLKDEFGQWEFAKKNDLNSVLASPIVVKDKFKGFIVYLSKKMEDFDNKVDREFLAKQINSSIEEIFVFAESFDRIHLQYTTLNRISEYEKEEHQYTSGNNRAYNCHYAAKNYLAEDMFDKAGHNFRKAAENMSQLPAPNHNFIIKNYTESSMAYARGGSKDDSRKSYNSLKDYINKRIEKAVEERKYIPDFYYNKLIRVLDEKGFDPFAGEVYIDKMDQRLKRFKEEQHTLRWWYMFWKLTSNYGESAGKFIGCTFLVIVAFAIFYLPCPDSWSWGPFCIQLEVKEKSFIYDFCDPQNIVKKIITSFTFSSAVFSTLGFSNITPANWWAQVVVTVEVLLGYAFLGTFVTLIGRKFLRKTY